MKSIDTKSCVKKAQRHDKDAFTELMQLYLKDMYRTAIAILMNEEDAADALQDTILTCWEKLYTLKKPEFFKTWMTRIL
ncbi:MAG: RNA polymerase subunit sigma-70, partial [Schaedlerella sp.]|uniref:sigma factor n=1 Tax=Schaedlerella sp. TaxID=2676057 RepID=UPI003527C01A